jgi:hypothetical protein
VLRERRRRASEFPDATAGVVAVKETRIMGDDAIPITLARLTRIKRA